MAVAPLAAAQNPPPAQTPDTLTPQQIFNDVFAPNSAIAGYVILSAGVVYRVEVEGDATVDFRVRRHPSMPPLLMVPLSREAAGMGTSSYLMVPPESDEYRLDVTVLGGEPVRVRVWSDPREMSRWARMRQATRALPKAGLGLRIGYVGAFARLPRGFSDSAGTASGLGAELCLGVVPRGGWSYGGFGGCVLQVAYYGRGVDGNVLFFSVAPRLEVTPRRSSIQVSVTAQAGLGTTLSVAAYGGDSETYLALGLGLDGAVPLSRHVWLDAEAGIVRIQPTAGGALIGAAHLVPHVATGLQFRF